MSQEIDNKSGNSRRRLLKGIAVGGGAIAGLKALPEQWSRPVVNSVLLPVHAQTSGAISFPLGRTVWPVPEGVSQLSFIVLGGSGGAGFMGTNSGSPGTGGEGGTATGTLNVSPGDSLIIHVAA